MSLFLITLLLAATVCTHGQEAVRDTDGNRVRISENYFIQPINTNTFGAGIVPLAAKTSRCEVLGIGVGIPGDPGVPVGFAFPPTLIPPLPFAVVRTNSDITIEFKVNICNEFSEFWEVDESSAFPEEPGVPINGNPREPNSRFKIEKVGEEDGTNIYRFTTSNGTVGTIPGSLFSPLLVFTNDLIKTIFVRFVKANDATTSDVVLSTSRVEKL